MTYLSSPAPTDIVLSTAERNQLLALLVDAYPNLDAAHALLEQAGIIQAIWPVHCDTMETFWRKLVSAVARRGERCV